MVTTERPTKTQKREFGRWRRVLALREGGLSITEIMLREDVSQSQIYALLAKARWARSLGWL